MIPSQPTVAAGAHSHRHWPVMGNPSGGGHHYHYHGMMETREREISNDACWWSQWFKQWEQLWRLSGLLAASLRCFQWMQLLLLPQGPQGLLILSPPQAVRCNVTPLICFSSSVPFASGCDNSKGGRGVAACVIWVHMNIGYTSRNPTPHCVISRYKNSRQIF